MQGVERAALLGVSVAQPLDGGDVVEGFGGADEGCTQKEGEEEEANAQREQREPPNITANGGLDRLAHRKHGHRRHTYHV